MDRDLLEKVLTAQVLALCEAAMARHTAARGHPTGRELDDAVALVRKCQAPLVARLLAPPGGDPARVAPGCWCGCSDPPAGAERLVPR